MKNLMSLLIVLLFTLIGKAQTKELGCATKYNEIPQEFTQRGGKYVTAAGELKVLVVFAKFKDDNNPHQYWSANSYPNEMNEFIDPDMQTGSSHYLNLTNYYNQMSFGNFKVIGSAIGVETPYPIEHYIPQNEIYPNRSHANKDVLLSVDDSIDYRDFDNWTYISNYFHSNEPDGIVDMIIVIWRGLVFSNNWYGEASLGGGPEFSVENNQVKIRMGYGGYPGNGSYGSGVTVQYWGERNPERCFKAVIHEVAHWLIHSDHPYSSFNHTFWGMLTLTSEGICANAYERERVAWIDPIEIESNILCAPMGDYITMPSAYKYHPPNGYQSEMYYFENHQQISIYDNGTSNPNDKGIFILHFRHGYYFGDCVRVLTSDGFWNWESTQLENCWGNELPSFNKGNVNRTGNGNRDRLVAPDSCCEFLYSYTNYYSQSECNDWLHGYGFKNTFNTTFNDVFSTWSNPPAKTWDGQSTDFIMEVTNESGSIVTARFAVQNSIGGKPSKPYLGWDPSKSDSSYLYGKIYLAWGADFWDSSQIEPDVNWSELQRRRGSESWTTVYTGTDRVWSDSSSYYNPAGTEPIYFRVRVRDSQDKWSIWSESFDTKMINHIITSTEELAINENAPLSGFELSQNFPNPFNPSTIIQYGIKERSSVELRLYDILGAQVVVLVNEEQEAGYYKVNFNAGSLASGIYFYRIQAGDFIQTKKMILLK
jgi:hypothetical protein